jgi:Ca-activated chloride channel family protein
MITEDFHFLRSLWLLSLLPALALWWQIRRGQDRTASWTQFIDSHLLEHLIVDKNKRRNIRPLHLLFVIWILASVALAGPAWQREPSPFADDEAGLVVLLKVSETMNGTDVQPSRLERAKQKLRDLLALRKGASTGLIVYSGSAHLVMPLTKDDRIINAMIEELTPELMPIDGDALIAAIEKAGYLFEKSNTSGSVLVMADTVSPSQVNALSADEIKLPVQFLAVHSPSIKIDDGLKRAASILNGSVVKMTFDRKDVEEIAESAQTEFRSLSSSQEGERWRDTGYAMIPLIALCGLMWSRKGWVIR